MNESTPLLSSENAGSISSDAGNSTETGDPPDTKAKMSSVDGIDSIASTNYIQDKAANTASGDKPQKRKKKVIKVCTASIKNAELRIQTEMTIHNLASQHLQCRQFWFFTVPQALLTMIAGILAFMASSAFFDERQTTILTEIVGSTSGVVIFLQTMSGVCSYGTRGAMHEAVAIDLRYVLNKLGVIAVRMGFGEDTILLKGVDDSTAKPGVNSTADPDDDEEDDRGNDSLSFQAIQSRLLQSLSGCKSIVPLELTEAFNLVKSNQKAMSSVTNSKIYCEKWGCAPRLNHDLKLVTDLAAEISDSFFFPMILPNATIVVQKAMKRHHKEIMAMSTFYGAGEYTDVEDGCCKVPCLG